jgi:hypothetical protein
MEALDEGLEEEEDGPFAIDVKDRGVAESRWMRSITNIIISLMSSFVPNAAIRLKIECKRGKNVPLS